ncbi:hypothetical protein [Brevundimonas sp.]|jgi:hypothetical protein|uniref:hypothetical protein n=1 Tax=Brevundimonas sp. TaxID=1871086 RepID=UPI003784B7EE
MDPILNYQMKEVLRQEKQKNMIRGGAKLNDLQEVGTLLDEVQVNRLINQEQNMARYFKQEVLPLTNFEASVDFNLDKYIEDVKTSIQGVIDQFLQGTRSFNFRTIESSYNVLVSYLKNYVEYSKLSTRLKAQIQNKMVSIATLLEQILLSIKINQSNKIILNEIKENILNNNYQPVNIKTVVEYNKIQSGKVSDNIAELKNDYYTLAQDIQNYISLGNIYPSFKKRFDILNIKIKSLEDKINKASNSIDIEKMSNEVTKLEDQFVQFREEHNLQFPQSMTVTGPIKMPGIDPIIASTLGPGFIGEDEMEEIDAGVLETKDGEEISTIPKEELITQITGNIDRLNGLNNEEQFKTYNTERGRKGIGKYLNTIIINPARADYNRYVNQSKIYISDAQEAKLRSVNIENLDRKDKEYSKFNSKMTQLVGVFQNLLDELNKAVTASGKPRNKKKQPKIIGGKMLKFKKYIF